jgi:tRNA pseudouridine55 synthase
VSGRAAAGLRQIDGFLNICKPLGWTSHDVVQLVRRRLGQRRVGHAGTLDPAATGVLPICLGRATRFADLVGDGVKVYAADVAFGHATDTCDAEGRVLDRAAVGGASAAPSPTLERARVALTGLVGPIEQVPPSYSAVKIQGEAAYALARRGEAVELPTRAVTIHSAAVLAWQPPRFSIVVRCSKGTYVRALARDLGHALGTEAYLDALVRMVVGSFTLANAVTVEMFERAVADGEWPRLVDAPDRAVRNLPAALLGTPSERAFGHGQSWVDADVAAPRAARAYAADGRFLGLLRAGEQAGRWQPAVSFVYDADASGDT